MTLALSPPWKAEEPHSAVWFPSRKAHVARWGSRSMKEASSTDGTADLGPLAPAMQVRSFGDVPGWDGLRGIALLIVFVAHMDVILPIPSLLVIPGATVSLDSFFVLSGFLITALLLKEQARYGKIGIGPFYRRRALRLLPALYVVVLVNALFVYATHQWVHT